LFVEAMRRPGGLRGSQVYRETLDERRQRASYEALAAGRYCLHRRYRERVRTS
jgi:hypothetical protein